MRFFDAHCDTIGKILEQGADFGSGGAGEGEGTTSNAGLHVTLPALRDAGVCAQVFASWVWSERYPGREFEAGLEMVEAVDKLCRSFPDELMLALSGEEIAAACEGGSKTAVVAGLEGADPLLGEVENLAVFRQAGVRLVTLAWGDNAFSGTVFGSGSGLTAKGRDLVEACEDCGILVDVSHASDAAFADVCAVASKPFVASHSNCRSLCPNDRNLTDAMIHTLGERGGVMGVNLGSGFLSPEFYAKEKAVRDEFFRSVKAGEKTVDEAGAISSAALAALPRPPLDLVAAHVLRAIDVGGEECVGLGGDLDGVDSLPRGMDGVGDYPSIAEHLRQVGLTAEQVEKVCFRNLARVFRDVIR